MYNRLNQDSKQRIQNIANGFRNFPAYAAYEINSFVYDLRSGAHALEITRNGQSVNLFLFFPAPNGKIDSISVYGVGLQGHYNAMRSSMMAFGMRISDISMDFGESEYIDVYLDY